jgi:hypothetical protein
MEKKATYGYVNKIYSILEGESFAAWLTVTTVLEEATARKLLSLWRR